MLSDIVHHDALPPDNYHVGESNQGHVDVKGVVGGRVVDDVGGGGGEEGGGGQVLTLSDMNPIVENIIRLLIIELCVCVSV